MRRAYVDRWDRRQVSTPLGGLSYVVCSGPQPFIGSARLEGQPIAPVEAHGALQQLGHVDAGLPYLGDGWAAGQPTCRAPVPTGGNSVATGVTERSRRALE